MVLISSAAGKKAAPKGAVRRRPAGPAATASAPANDVPQEVAPTEPPTQTPAVEEPPQTERVVLADTATQRTTEPEPEQQTQQEPAVQPVTQTEPEPAQDAVPAAEQEAIDVVESALAQVERPREASAVEADKDEDVPMEEVSVPVVEPTQAPTDSTQDVPQNQETQPQAVEETPPAQTLAQSISAPQPIRATRPATKRAREAASASASARPAKKTKKSSARSNAKVQAEVQADDPAASSSATTPAGTVEGSATPAPTEPRSTRRKQPAKKAQFQRNTRSKMKSAATITNSDDEGEAAPSPESPQDEDVSATPAPREPKQRRKKKQVRIAEPEGEGDEAAGEGADQGQDDVQEASEESDPEQHEIDPENQSMFNLTHDTIYGKTSERGKKMAEIDWDEIAQKRRDEAAAIVAGQPPEPASAVVRSVEGPDGTAVPQTEEAEQAPAQQTAGASTGNEAFLVDADGNIVLDEATVRHDATAQAMQAAETGAVEDVNDLTNQLNRTTWINNNRRDPIDRVPLWKWKSDPWTEEETDRFYDALAMFGSDFFIISKMFPGKNRRMIKAKFTREEKLDGKRVDDALMGKTASKAMDLDFYSRESGRDVSVFMRYDGLEHAQGIINESIKDKHEATVAAAQREAALAEEKAAREKDEKKEKSKTARKARKQRAKAGGTLGGVPDDD